MKGKTGVRRLKVKGKVKVKVKVKEVSQRVMLAMGETKMPPWVPLEIIQVHKYHFLFEQFLPQ
jgi:hypothetical protein